MATYPSAKFMECLQYAAIKHRQQRRKVSLLKRNKWYI